MSTTTSLTSTACRRTGLGWSMLVAAWTMALGMAVAGCGRDEPADTDPPASSVETLSTDRSSRSVPPAPAGTTTATEGSGPSNAGPRIVRLEIDPVVQCIGPASVEVDVTYEAAGADRVIFLVDDAQVPGNLPPVGTARVPLECDGAIHVVVATAVASDGRTGVESKAVQTDTEPPPE